MAEQVHTNASGSYDVSVIDSVLPPQPYYNFGLFSASNSGKSLQASTFIQNFNYFYPYYDVKQVIIVSPHDEYDAIRAHHYPVLYFDKFDERLFEAIEDVPGEQGVTIVWLDDVCTQLANSDAFVNLITVDTHHKRLCTIVCAHNVYQFYTNQWRTFVRNLGLIGLGNSVMQRQATGKLFQQIFGAGGAKKASDALQQAETIERERWDSAYWFLFLNLTPQCRFCDRLFCQPFSNLPVILRATK